MCTNQTKTDLVGFSNVFHQVQILSVFFICRGLFTSFCICYIACYTQWWHRFTDTTTDNSLWSLIEIICPFISSLWAIAIESILHYLIILAKIGRRNQLWGLSHWWCTASFQSSSISWQLSHNMNWDSKPVHNVPFTRASSESE